MTAQSSEPTDRQAPFGAQQRRSRTPLVFLGLLYAIWFVILFWMAAFKSGQ